MSAYWYYHCTDCGENNEDGIQHGEEALRDFKRIVDAIGDLDMSWIDLSIINYACYDHLLFLQTHAGHNITLFNSSEGFVSL